MENKDIEKYVTKRRVSRIEDIISRRTRNLVLLLEDVHDPHNIAACMRSAEGLGIQEIHVIRGKKSFVPHPKVTQGAGKWLEVYRYETPAEAIDALKARGYKIWSAALTENAVPIYEMDFSDKIALTFGNEHDGLSAELVALSDGVFHLPMRGFTQSFNISVACGMTLFYAVSERRRILGEDGDLGDKDSAALRQVWIEKSIPRVDTLKKELARRSSEDS